MGDAYLLPAIASVVLGGTHILGGRGSQANKDYTLAAGRRAVADHQGAFVWADSRDEDFSSAANNANGAPNSIE